MAAVIIIATAILIFWGMLSLGGFTNKPQQKQPSKPKLNYSPNTIRSNPKPNKGEVIVRTLDLPDDPKNGIFYTKIAGITHYCNPSDEGYFEGVIYNDSDNPYDGNAMAIVSMNKKLLGYIPKDETNDFSCKSHR